MPDIPTAALAKAVESISRIRPGRTVRRNDRLAGEEYEDLFTWANDDLQKEARSLDGVKNDLIERGMLGSGDHGSRLKEVRDEYARRALCS